MALNIYGIQKLTLLDFPSKVACTLFTYGCNFRCPFCHNKSLVTDKCDEPIAYQEIIDFLNSRKKMLDGICLTGGEPLINNEVAEFFKDVRKLGLLIKLDTNGSFPEKLNELINEGLVDYVAMDIKNCKDKYNETCGVKVNIENIEKSVDIIMNSNLNYEFRTTIVSEFHDNESIEKLGQWIKGAKAYYLQNFVDNGNLVGKASGVSKEKMHEFLDIAKKYVPNSNIRGI